LLDVVVVVVIVVVVVVVVGVVLVADPDELEALGVLLACATLLGS
jgi:hypothetical protein